MAANPSNSFNYRIVIKLSIATTLVGKNLDALFALLLVTITYFTIEVMLIKLITLLGTIIAPDYYFSNNKTRLTRSSFSRLLPTPLFLSPNILAPSYVQTY